MATQASDSIRQKPRATTADDLAVIVQRAQSFTNASGAAIAISEGNTDEIVCRARSGSSAPDVGAVLRVQGTFTGICIQTGKELRCDDAETDTRMDTGAIRALGIRSMVVTPIRDEGKVIGVLAVFAPTPHAFTITHVAVLKTMADQITTLLQKERRTKDDPRVQEPAPPPAPIPVAMPKPAIPAVPLPPPVVIKPTSGSSAAAAAPARSPRIEPRSEPRIEPRIEPQAVALAADIAAPVPFPRREERREFKPEPAPVSRPDTASIPRPDTASIPKPDTASISKTNLGTLDAVAGEPSKSSASKLILLGVVVVIAAVAAAGWWYLNRHKADSQTQPQQQQQNSAPAASAPVPPTPAAASVAANPTAPAASAPSSAKADVAEKTESKKPESKKKDQPTAPPPPTTVEMASGPSKIVQPAAPSPAADVSPSLALGGGASSGLASLARPVGTSTPSMVAQSELVNAKAIKAVPASYPELAKARRISGAVIVKVTVGKDGKVNNPRFISGPIIFRDAAFDAVKQWLFKPAELNGKPIEQETEIRVNFHP